MIDCMACLVNLARGAPEAISTVSRDGIVHAVSIVSWTAGAFITCSLRTYVLQGHTGWTSRRAESVRR